MFSKMKVITRFQVRSCIFVHVYQNIYEQDVREGKKIYTRHNFAYSRSIVKPFEYQSSFTKNMYQRDMRKEKISQPIIMFFYKIIFHNSKIDIF